MRRVGGARAHGDLPERRPTQPVSQSIFPVSNPCSTASSLKPVVPTFQGRPGGEDLNWNLRVSNWTRFSTKRSTSGPAAVRLPAGCPVVTVHIPLSAYKTLLSMRYSDCKQFA